MKAATTATLHLARTLTTRTIQSAFSRRSFAAATCAPLPGPDDVQTQMINEAQLLCNMTDAPFGATPTMVVGIDVGAERAQRQRQTPNAAVRDNALRSGLSPNLQAFLRTTQSPANNNAARDFYLRGISSSSGSRIKQVEELSSEEQKTKDDFAKMILAADAPWVN